MTAGRTNHTAFSSAQNIDAEEKREHAERLLMLQRVMGCHAPNLFSKQEQYIETSPDEWYSDDFLNDFVISAGSEVVQIGAFKFKNERDFSVRVIIERISK